MRLGDVLHVRAFAAQLLVRFSLGPIIIRLGDDPVVNAGNDFLNRRAAVGALGSGGPRLRERKTGKQSCSERKRSGGTNKSQIHRLTRTSEWTAGSTIGIDAIVNGLGAIAPQDGLDDLESSSFPISPGKFRAKTG